MPVLPTYSSKQNIQARPIGVPITDSDANIVQDQKVLKTMTEVAQKWSDAQDVMQSTEAKVKWEIKSAEIKARADADKDINNSNKYIQELQKAKTDSISGISNQLNAQKAALELDYNTQLATIEIESGFKKKQLLNNAFNLEVSTEASSTARSNATGNLRIDIDNQVLTDIQKNVTSGTITPLHGKTLWDSYLLGSAYKDMMKNPDYVISELRKDDGGEYKSIESAKDRSTLLTSAIEFKNKRVKEEKAFAKEERIKAETDIALNIASGNPLDLNKIRNGVSSGVFDPDFAEAARKAYLSSFDPSEIKDSEAFVQLTESIYKIDSKEGVRKAIYNILKEKGNGNISVDDMTILIHSAKKYGEMEAVTKRNAASQAINTLGKWADQSNLPRKDIFKVFQKEIANGSSVNDASNVAMKKVIVDNIPEASNLDDVPNIVVGKNSPIRYIFPKETKVYPNRIYNPATGKLESNPEVNKNAKRSNTK